MPTFHDPVTDAAEAREVLRALAHASRTFDDPAHTYTVMGELLGGLRSLVQVLEQVATAHTWDESRAHTDSGDHWAGAEEAFAAANSLRRAASLVHRAELAVDQASQHSGRIAWAPAAERRSTSPERTPRALFGNGDRFAHRALSERRGLSL